ncbi:hypothetical protein [Bradyrhizobium sp. AZCC 2289]|uniref:hypothetical protein n=1 Tax=Bradyrhizobium sp. AZCC 2289 TaxID=3117026 RepID=UPI0030216F3E
MDIQFTEEQELLRSSIQRFLRDQYDFDERRKIVATDEGWSRKHWSAFAELGLCAASIAIQPISTCKASKPWMVGGLPNSR